MKVHKVYVLLVCLIFMIAYLYFSSCKHEIIIPENIPEICFEGEVLPVFRNSCGMTGCHDGSGERNFHLTDYAGISQSVVAGKPYESPAYKAIIAKSGEGKMPPSNPLSLENRTIIRLWIQQGARLTSCSDTASQLSEFDNPRACFSRDILPVLVSSCALPGCHDAATHKGGYSYTGYSETLKSVSPGNPSGSKLSQVITTLSGENRMPPSPKNRLSTAVIDSIAAWIRYGARDEICGEACDTINPVTFSGTIWPVIQKICSGCHNGTTASGGIRLENYTNVSSVVSGGMLMNALKGNGVQKMPPAGSLSSCRIRQFGLWINNGYKNN